MQYLFQLSRVYNAVHLISIQHSSAEQGWEFPNHRHTILEFKYCIKGRIEHKINGKTYITNQGDSVIMKAGVYHQMKVLEDCEFFGFHFDMEMPTVYSIFQSIPDPFIPANLGGFIKQWVNQFMSDFGSDFSQLHHLPQTTVHYSVENNLKILKMHSSFVEFISSLAKFYYEPSQVLDDVVHSSHLYIAHQTAFELNNTEQYDLQIGEIALKLNVHRSHITNCFKEVYGVTPKQYLLQLRTQKAKQYLLETNLTVEDIADKLSFSSTAHFTKFFAKQTGSSPSHYRAKREM
ncbi:AraC family transcriptional regulator [Paenibacillus piri]|uniref:AraC family transcriptional regulator n=1 Tax=Paenibacillus piri TaxID=2547395 RepID=A0A4R5KFH9_9BACL|nr:helix-turn-helix domain-containing protein [Paenibacillus piri]TDF93445.1 AraC family transcriptional regulator [Paenibacillus piri]